MIPFKSFIRQLCEAVNSVARDRQTELDAVLSGTFTKETENGTDLYTPREVRFKVPYTDDKDQTAWRTVQVPLATLVTPRTVQMDKITFFGGLQPFPQIRRADDGKASQIPSFS